MKAISIKQPWAWLILNAGKNIENRTWRTNYRGRVLIHAGKGLTQHDWLNGLESLWANPAARRDFPGPAMFQRGGIVGSVEIVDCVTASNSPWFAGPYGWVLRDPQPLPFQPCRGSLSFFIPQPIRP
jgi:hypothetical protein